VTIRCSRRRAWRRHGAYSKIAPGLPHALHMAVATFHPAGTLGGFDLIETSPAVAAARKHGDQGEEFHALDYLTYAYLQLGRNAEAQEDQREPPRTEQRENRRSRFKINYATAAIRARLRIGTANTGRKPKNLVADPGVEPQVSGDFSHWAAGNWVPAPHGKPAGRRDERQKRCAGFPWN